MGDDNGRCLLHNQIEGLLDLGFGEGVNAGRGLIQNEDARLMNEHAHEGDELPLAHRETAPPLPDRAVQAVGQCFQPFAVANEVGITHDFGLVNFGIAVADVFGHCAIKQKGHLGNDAELAAVGGQIEGADGYAINE